MTAAEIIPRESSALSGSSSGTPSQRAELLAVASAALSSGCNSISVTVYGEEIHRGPIDESAERQRDRMLAAILEDASERDAATRHTYTISAWRDDREVNRATLRLAGGARHGGAAAVSIEPSTTGALRMVMRHLEGVTGLMVKSHGTSVETLTITIRDLHTRCRELEAQNDAYRKELREYREGHGVELARLEAERERSRVYRHLGEQLIRYMPHVLARWFPMPQPGAADQKPSTPPELDRAVAAVVGALASTTDDQIAAMRASLSPAQLLLLERARMGATVTPDELRAFGSLDDDGARRALEVLRPDQLERFAAALPIVLEAANQ